MGQFDSLLWENRASRVARPWSGGPRRPSPANPLTEWTARPLGRLGRPLVVEIETYLAFFAIVQADEAHDAIP